MAIFVDDLQGATTSLASWVPDTGTSWTLLWSTGGRVLQVIAGGVRADGNSGDNGIMYTADGTYPTANYEAEITFVTTFNTITPLYLGVRVTDQENGYWVRLVLSSGGSNAQLYKKVSGTWSTLGSAVTIADGSVVKLRANGTAIEVDDDGVNVISVTDSDLSGTGKCGLAHGGGAELVASTDDTRATTMVHHLTVTDLGSGSSSYTETGADIWGTVASGADVAALVDAGAAVYGEMAAGADIGAFVDSAPAVWGTITSGADVYTPFGGTAYVETGYAEFAAVAAGNTVAAFVDAGAGVWGNVTSGDYPSTNDPNPAHYPVYVRQYAARVGQTDNAVRQQARKVR